MPRVNHSSIVDFLTQGQRAESVGKEEVMVVSPSPASLLEARDRDPLDADDLMAIPRRSFRAAGQTVAVPLSIAAQHDDAVVIRFNEVLGLVRRSKALLTPAFIFRVLRAARRGPVVTPAGSQADGAVIAPTVPWPERHDACQCDWGSRPSRGVFVRSAHYRIDSTFHGSGMAPTGISISVGSLALIDSAS